MNYYEHHLGDWAAATGHLTWDEDMAYTRLLRAYYHHERAIPEGQQYRLAKASTPAQRKAVDQVLAEFFELRDGLHHQKRADAEVERYQDKQRKAKASANARWAQSERNANEMRTHVDRHQSDASASRKDSKPYKNGHASPELDIALKSLMSNEQEHSNAMRTHSEGNALQTPDTRHQSKEEGESAQREKPPAARKRAPTLARPDDVAEKVWNDWLQLRKAKRAPVTGTVLDGARVEAGKAGLTLDAFLRVWCNRGSQGLLADWLKPNERAPQRQNGHEAEPEWRREQRERNEAALGPYAAKRRTTTVDMEAPDGPAFLVG